MEITLVPVSAEDRFRLWYKEPIEALREVKGGQAAIVALMIALPLYERYYRYIVTKGTPDNRPQWVKDDLKFNSTDEAKIFWNVFRDGLCHTGSFLEESQKAADVGLPTPRIALDGKFPNLPQFAKNQDGDDVIALNPWGLVLHIFNKFEGNVELLEYEPAPLLPLHYIVSKA